MSLLSVTNSSWALLRHTIVPNKTVLLTGLTDTFITYGHPIFECSTLFVDNCDKEWTFRHLNRYRFPHLHTLWLNSHPEHMLLNILRDTNRVYLTRKYKVMNDVEIQLNNIEYKYLCKLDVIDEQTFMTELGKYPRIV